MMVKLSILIVSWNTADLLRACLRSVYEYSPAATFEVWVVDNASHDGSAEMVRREFPQVKLVAKDVNGGFAAGNNEALPLCAGEYVLLLNPDTVVKPNALQALVDFLDETPDAGAAGSMLLNPDGSLQPSAFPSPTLRRELWRLFHLDRIRPYGIYHMQQWDTAVPREVDVLQGASLLIRRDILNQIGLFDTTYFMYSEEVDLCRRLQLAGWRLYWVPASRVVHYGGQSTRQIAEQMFIQLYRGKLLYFRKHYGRFHAWAYKAVLALASVARLALTPLAVMQSAEKRQQSLTLARYYAHLVKAIPSF